MRLNYNFAFKNSKLRQWQRPSPPNLLVTDATFRKKIIYLKDQLLINSGLLFPPSLILLVSLGFQVLNIYPSKVLKNLENDHNQYVLISNKLANLNISKQKFKKNINNLRPYFTEATTSYLFAFYLQNSVPNGVKLLNYSFSDNGFEITANSYTLDALNEFLTLIIESPVINKNSVMINQLRRQQKGKTNNESLNFDYELLLYGEVKKLNVNDRQTFYKESRANGLLKKIQRYNNLNNLLRS